MTTTTLAITSVVLVCILCGVVYFFTPARTLWLIVRVTPYEQTITNAPTVLVLGDSTGYGTGAKHTNESIAGRLGRDFAVTIQNRSKNGRTIGELLADTEDFSGTYELILLQIGANDLLHKRDQSVVESELRRLVERLTPHTAHLVMMSSGNVGASPQFSGTQADQYEVLSREYRALFLQVASETELVYVDLFVEPENDIFVQQPNTYMSFDGLHPSSAGYEKWYRKLRPIIDPMLAGFDK